MLKKEDGRIDWSHEAPAIHARVRAMTPWPGAFTVLGRDRLKIFRVRPEPGQAPAPPGTILESGRSGIRVAAGNGSVVILELQGTSGKRLTADAYLRGRDLPPGSLLNG